MFLGPKSKTLIFLGGQTHLLILTLTLGQNKVIKILVYFSLFYAIIILGIHKIKGTLDFSE